MGMFYNIIFLKSMFYKNQWFALKKRQLANLCVSRLSIAVTKYT